MSKVLENGSEKWYNVVVTSETFMRISFNMIKFIKSYKLVIALFIVSFAVFSFPFLCSSAETELETTLSQEEIYEGYSFSVDSKLVFVLDNEETAQQIKQSLINKAQRYYNTGENFSLLNTIQISKGEFHKSDFFTIEEAEKSVGISLTLGAPTIQTKSGDEITLSLAHTSLREEYENTDFNVKYEYTYGVNQSYEKVVSAGEQGTVKRVYESKMVDGKAVSSSLILESVISEPKDKIIEIGVTPSMQLSYSDLAYFIKPYDGKISSDYGYRYLNGYEFHTGIDLVAKSGSCYGKNAVAAADGVVVESGYSSSRGNYIIIKHEYGFSTVYMHFAKRLVSAGDTVLAGDPIGTIGSTGRSTGPHLHFEIRLHGEHTNPENYLSFK